MNYNKWKKPVIIISVITIVSLISLLVVVPSAYGDQFFSFSFQLYEVVAWGSYGNSMEIVYVNGSVIGVSWISLTVNVTNSYLVPVQVRYNGFNFVMLIYNQTVTDPADVVGNKDFLVWGSFRTAYAIQGWGMYGFDIWSIALGNITGYEYYVIRKDLSNYTKTIRVGTTHYDPVFYDVPFFPMSYWAGQNLHGRPVSPGNYYIYCIAYGKVSDKPINLTVTSVLWGS